MDRTISWLGILSMVRSPWAAKTASDETLSYPSAYTPPLSPPSHRRPEVWFCPVFRKLRESPNRAINNPLIPHRDAAQLACCLARCVRYAYSPVPLQSDIHRTHGTTSASPV